jgi:SAM-dependent methyltransferase
MINDKENILAGLANRPQVKLELGCGSNKRDPEAIGIDMLDHACVDLVGDVFEALRQFPDDSVDTVYSSHFIEHIENVSGLLDELARVVKTDGSVVIVAPHFSNPHFYSDYTHRTFFGLYSFSYFTVNPYFSRKVPHYNLAPSFETVSVDLVFKSFPPHYVRHGIKKAIGALFNLNNYMKELYEENFCYLFPCYEIRYRLRRS